ncbi:MAG TPA: hypothetical protein VHZ76_01210 [Gammaproteobacteria bacterium]|jgi:hypothetical protein|nr:hypothetical protein [Gammaproteobacteria bacterium]
MKKLIYIAVAIAFAMNCFIDAKIMKRKPVLVDKNTKELLVDIKKIQASTTPEEKKENIDKMVKDTQKDPYMILKAQEVMILQEIEDKDLEIEEMEGFGLTSFFYKSEELTEARNEIAELYQQLEEIQSQLNEIKKKQPTIETKIKDYTFHKLIGAAGVAVLALIALQVYGGFNITGNISSAAQKVWGSIPSFRDTAGTVGSFAAGLVVNELKAIALQKTYNTLMSYIQDPNTDPEMREEYNKEAEKTKTELDEIQAKIKEEKKLQEQIAQRNL